MKNSESKQNLIASLLAILIGFLIGFIVILIANPSQAFRAMGIMLSGGFYKGLRSTLEEACKKENIDFSVPRMSYCTDNAAMIGAAAYYAYKKGIVADQTLTAMATDTLYKYK